MQSLTIDPRISADRDFLSAVRIANRILEDKLGASAESASVAWQLGEVDGFPLLFLEIVDQTDRAGARFTLEELRNPKQTSRRIIRLWGDLLQVRSHRQIERLNEDPAPPDGERVLDFISDALYEFAERHGQEPSELQLPIRYAIALRKRGHPFWGDMLRKIREKGVRALEDKPLFGVPVRLVSGVGAELALE